MARVTVSVVTIFFNAETFIGEAVESVLAQTHADWELLLADDGSTDRSTEIAKRYATNYPGKVRYLEHPGHANRGMSATRNLAIRSSAGEYVAFLDADDVWLPHKLERLVAILVSQPRAAMVYGPSLYWYSWTGLPDDRQRDYLWDLGLEPDALVEPPLLLNLLLGNTASPPPTDVMVRRDVCERVGMFEESFTGDRQLYEDQAFFAKVYLGECVYVSSECWDRYRIHPDSCDSVVTNAGRHHAVRRFFLHWLRDYLTRENVDDVEVLESLEQALEPYRDGNLPEDDEDDQDGGYDVRRMAWWLRVAPGNRASLEFPTEGADTVRVAVEKAGTGIGHDIQLNMPRLRVEANGRYTVRFRVRADRARVACWGVARGYPPWTNLGMHREIALSTEWQWVEQEFVSEADSNNARLYFDVGGGDVSLELASVSIHGAAADRSAGPDLGRDGSVPFSGQQGTSDHE
jgi:glycosyltransferase involved in cell wall biosynthesis